MIEYYLCDTLTDSCIATVTTNEDREKSEVIDALDYMGYDFNRFNLLTSLAYHYETIDCQYYGNLEINQALWVKSENENIQKT